VLKTFIAGIIIGIVAVAGAVYLTPVVDVQREASIVSVTTNGGNSETFHVNVPADRVMIGAQGRREPLPAGMEWPEDPVFSNARAEIFKLRNSRDAVVGVASRFSASDANTGDVLEWVLHLPARGSLYVTMSPSPVNGGGRVGDMRAGTREFKDLVGEVRERWLPDASGDGEGGSGRIQLATNYISTKVVEEIEAATP
jgi:hypothetical protein